MASFKDLLKELNVRYENDVATLTAQCHRLIQENQRLKGNEERELTVEVQQEDAETMDKENENADAVGPTRTQRQALSGITGSMHFGSKKTVLPKTQSAILVNSRLVRVLSTGLDWWSSLEEPKRSGIIYKIVESKCFWCISILVILINAVSITSITDISLAEDWGGGIPTALINVEIACLTFYLLELVLRLAVHRVYFFVNENSGWNWLDLLLVAFSIVEIAVLWGTDGESGTVLYMRTLRICKVSKAVRIFRVLTAFRELASLLESFRSSLMAMFWSLALLSFLLFLSALVFAQGIADGLSDASVLPSEASLLGFGSVMETMVSLYMSVTGGNDWIQYYRLFEKLQSFYHWLYLGFIFFFTFAIFNILTALFVEKAMAASRPDRHRQMVLERRKFAEQAAELRELFSKMDKDQSGRITQEEFLECMRDSEILSYMLSVGLDVYDAQYLFELVADNQGELEISRFVDGCMAVKGAASALDVQKQLAHIEQVEHKLEAWEKEYWPALMSFASGVHLKL